MSSTKTGGPPVYNGRYALRNQIARGGTAQVYLARDLLLDRPVALKMLFPELSADRSFVDRFRREAQAAANLSHPNIVPVFDWGESDRTYYIVMEYVDGEPLSSIIRTQAPVDGIQAAGIAADIAKALSYAHRHGVVHRDVKPGNVLITSDGQVKVTDFGIARAIGTDENVTQTGIVMGTATYFSPEQAQGLGVDGRSDVYSLGVVLYEMVTGRPPFSGETPVSIAYQHVRETPPTPRSINRGVPVPLEAIILQAMAKQPTERYASAQDLQADLQRYVQGQTPLAMADPGGRGAPVPPVSERHQATQVLGAAGGAALGASAVAAGRPSDATTALPPNRGTTMAGAAATGTEGMKVEGRPPLPKRRTLEWSLAALVLLGIIAGIIYLGGHALGYFGGDAWFPNPNVENHTALDATTILADKGLKWHLKYGNNSLPANEVYSQTPAPATSVQQGDYLTLYISTGPKSVPLPDVIGDSKAVALETLTNLGLKPHSVPGPAPASSPYNGKQGTVWNQSPLATNNKSVKVGSTVTIYVVQGSSNISVPTVSNDSQSKAINILDNAGFKVSDQSTSQTSPTIQAGFVIGTTPPALSLQAPGTTITLIVSSGPPPPNIPVPNVVGKNVNDASTTLTNDGFVPAQVTVDVCQQNQQNIVQSTSPSANSPIQKGSTVTMAVGLYAPLSSTCSTTTTTSPSPTTTTPTTTPGPPSG